MSESDRAAEYRRTLKNRARAKRTTEKRLAGNAAARKALAEKTDPLLYLDADGVPCGDVHD